MKTVPADVPLVEKDFYLKEFRSKSLLFVLRVADLVSLGDRRSVEDVLSTLVRNETRTLLLLETDGTAQQHRCIEALYQQCAQVLKSTLPTPTVLSPEADDDQLLIQAWEVLRTVPIFIGLWPEQANVSLLLCAQRLAIRLKVYKLVLLDQQGGLTSARGPMSFLNGPTLKVLQSKIENTDRYVERRFQLETAWRVLEGGVGIYAHGRRPHARGLRLVDIPLAAWSAVQRRQISARGVRRCRARDSVQILRRHSSPAAPDVRFRDRAQMGEMVLLPRDSRPRPFGITNDYLHAVRHHDLVRCSRRRAGIELAHGRNFHHSACAHARISRRMFRAVGLTRRRARFVAGTPFNGGSCDRAVSSRRRGILGPPAHDRPDRALRLAETRPVRTDDLARPRRPNSRRALCLVPVRTKSAGSLRCMTLSCCANSTR